jgi:putative endonuclease
MRSGSTAAGLLPRSVAAEAEQGWFVYLLTCSDGSIYTGITTDPQRRCREHNAGRGAAYTRSRTPVRLLYCEAVSSRSAALKRELEIKGWPRRRKLELAGETAGTDPEGGSGAAAR